MAGTGQMDIRFRATADQQQPAPEQQQPAAKPQIFGVPLQVVKKSVKPIVKPAPSVEQEKEAVVEVTASKVSSEELDNKVTRSNSSSSMGSTSRGGGRGSASKESTPARGGAAARKPRKP